MAFLSNFLDNLPVIGNIRQGVQSFTKAPDTLDIAERLVTGQKPEQEELIDLATSLAAIGGGIKRPPRPQKLFTLQVGKDIIRNVPDIDVFGWGRFARRQGLPFKVRPILKKGRSKGRRIR